MPQPGAILRRGLLFETELLWGLENKKQSQLRKPMASTVFGWETATEAVVAVVGREEGR